LIPVPSAGWICVCVTVKSIIISTTSIDIIDWLLLVFVSVVVSGGLTVPLAAIPPKLVGAVTKTSNSTLELLGILAIDAVSTLLFTLMLEISEAPALLFCEV